MIQSLACLADGNLIYLLKYPMSIHFSNRRLVSSSTCSCNNDNSRGSTSNNGGSNNIDNGNRDDASCL